MAPANNANTDAAVAAAINAMEDIVTKPPPGIILPPKEIRLFIEKSAGFVVRNGPDFEARIRDNNSGNPRFSFVNTDDAYYPFYQWRLSEIAQGNTTAVAAGREKEGGHAPAKKGPAEPPEFLFSARMPMVNANDLDVVKMTALFVAKSGRNWMTQLSQREGGNYQYDFLRPQHSLHQFFQRLVDQYSLLLTGTTAEGSKAEKARIEELEANAVNRFHILDRAKMRAEWAKHQESKKAKKEAKEQEEQVAYAQIDWHDFNVVGEIMFTEEDEHIELPPPTSLNDLQSASMEQKAQYRLAIEEATPGDMSYYSQPQFQAQAPPVQMPNFTPQYLPPFSGAPAYPLQPPMPPPQPTPQQLPFPQQPIQPQMPQRTMQEEEEEANIQARQAERERAAQAMAAAKSATAPGPMRIVQSGAAPRGARGRRANVQMVQCPNCKDQIPFDELEQHMKSKSPALALICNIARANHCCSRTSRSSLARPESKGAITRFHDEFVHTRCSQQPQASCLAKN
jgi:splicing factor 3A subunit 1